MVLNKLAVILCVLASVLASGVELSFAATSCLSILDTQEKVLTTSADNPYVFSGPNLNIHLKANCSIPKKPNNNPKPKAVTQGNRNGVTVDKIKIEYSDGRTLLFFIDDFAFEYEDRYQTVAFSKPLIFHNVRKDLKIKFSINKSYVGENANILDEIIFYAKYAKTASRPVVLRPDLTISGGGAVTEGTAASFTVTASPAPTSPLTVNLTVADAAGSDFVATGNEGTQTVTVPASGTATYTVATEGDSTDEPSGPVTVTIASGSGYSVTAASGSAGVAVTDDDATAVTLSAPAGDVAEGDGRKTLTLTLGRALVAGERLIVPLTLGGAAALGSDYTLAAPDATPQGVSYAHLGSTDVAHPPAVTFTGPSATAATVIMAAGADAVDEGAGEQVTVAPGTLAATGLGGGASGGGSVAFAIVEPAPTPPGVDPAVIAEVRALAGQTHHGTAHVTRWRRVLVAFGVETYPGLSPTTAAEAEANAKRYSSPLWPQIAGILAALEAVPEPQQQPVTLPEVSVAAGAAPVTEGGDAVFTFTASPTPASALAVSVTVAADGDYGIAGGSQTVTIPPTGSFTLPLATTGDTTDEPDGSVTVTVNDGDGYTVGASASGTVSIEDDDLPPPTPTGVAPALLAEVKGHIADFKARNHGAGIRDWTLVLDRLEGRTGMSDEDIAAWLARSRLHGWQDGIQTLPKVQAALAALEAAPEPQQQPVTLPEVSVAAGAAPVTEGGDATFTFTASPLPTSPLAVTVSVAADGDYGIDGGSRTVTIPPTGSFTLTLATTGDTTDEPDGSVTVTVNDGAGYTVGASASGTVSVQDDDLPPPAVSITAAAAVTEGGAASFTVSADRAPDADLTVTLAISEATGGDHVAADDEGSRSVTIATGETEAVFSVATVDDAVDEPDGSVTVTLAAGDGYTVSPSPGDAATMAVSDNDAVAGPVLSVADATVTEGEWAEMMEFTVRLSAPAAKRVRVRASTRVSTPVSARPKEDYWPLRSDLVTFYPGETEKATWVYIYNDSHDEDPETFEVVLSAADGATIGDGVAVGTIVNNDPMPAAWLARFGRTVAQQALDGIAGRLAAPRTPGTQGTLAGQPFTLRARGGADTAPDASAPGTSLLAGLSAQVLPTLTNGGAGAGVAAGFDPGAPGRGGVGGPAARTLTLRDVLLGSSFTATGQPDAHGGSFAVWGRAAQATFEGREGTFALDGETTTAMLGTDYAQDRWLLGVTLLQSLGTGGYDDRDATPAETCADLPAAMAAAMPPGVCNGAVREGAGSVESTLTAAVPYAAFQASERLKLWGAAGYGAGDVTLAPETGGTLKTDIAWTMAELGLRGTVLAPPPAGTGPTLAVTSDALWARTTSEKVQNGLAASNSAVTRLRLGLEGQWAVALETLGQLTPTLAVGARHDGGDAETGFGVELGGGLAWHAPRVGLALTLEGRTLLTHRDEAFKDQGVAAAFTFDPDPTTPRGPSLTVRQDWGGQATGGVDALFAANPLTQRPGTTATQSRWAAEAAWGFPAFGGHFTGSPHVGVGLAPGTRDYRLGWRLVPATPAAALSLDLQATRRELDAAQPEHTVGLEITTRW